MPNVCRAIFVIDARCVCSFSPRSSPLPARSAIVLAGAFSLPRGRSADSASLCYRMVIPGLDKALKRAGYDPPVHFREQTGELILRRPYLAHSASS